MAILIIEQVDLDKLEWQRVKLDSLESTLIDQKMFRTNAPVMEALRGVINMLDSWSDERYFKEEQHD